MDKQYEAQYHSLEEQNWWFAGRRHMVWELIEQLQLPKSAAVLEIGCSGGPLLSQLRAAGYQHATGIDVSEPAITLAQERGLPDVHVMDGARLDFPDQSFDLVIASDVLEHIADEHAALKEWRRVLRPGGQLLVFVPAHAYLWSQHDVVNHHFRRYSRRHLRQALQTNGFRVQHLSFWNNLLYFPTAAVRLLQRVLPPRPQGDLLTLPPTTNKLLLNMLKLENRLSKKMPVPFGVSVFASATVAE